MENWRRGVLEDLPGLLLRLFFFVVLEWVSLRVMGTLLYELFGYFAAAALGTFLAAVLSNALTVRIYERGRMEDVGMGWSAPAQRHLLLGLAGGIAAGAAVVGLLLALRLSVLEPSTDAPFSAGKLIFVTVMLLFGATGEELLFRGYGFQLLMKRLGPWIVVPLSALVFGWAHRDNISAGWLGLTNTSLWGLVLGFAYWRARDLWLPIGLHFGWNWVLPMAGANLSGFTMGLTGRVLRPASPAWWSGGEYGPEASVLTTVAALVLTVWLWRARVGPVEALGAPENEGTANEGDDSGGEGGAGPDAGADVGAGPKGQG
jgi:hypothetical protein